AVEQPGLERAAADAVGVDDEAAFAEQDLPAHDVGHAVELAARHGADVVGVVPAIGHQFGIAPDLELPVGVVSPPGGYAVVRPLGFITDPDDVQGLRDHGALLSLSS